MAAVPGAPIRNSPASLRAQELLVLEVPAHGATTSLQAHRHPARGRVRGSVLLGLRAATDRDAHAHRIPLLASDNPESKGRPTKRLRELLAPLSFHDMRQLWLSQVLSEAGDWAARVALAVLVLERSHSVALSALVTTASLLPSVGIGQWLATYGDRLPRRRLMVVSDLSRAGVFALLVLPLPIWAILLLVFLAGCASAPFEAARSALMPSTVPEDMYPAALALALATYQFAIIAGTLLGGALLAAIGARAAVAANCLSFLASAGLIARLKGGSEPTSRDRPVRVRDG